MVDVARQTLWLAGVPLVALVGGLAGFFPVFVMGLVVPIFLVGPLSLLSAAWLATVTAGWTANFARWDQNRSRLLVTLGVSLAGAVLALPPYWAMAWLVNSLDAPPTLAVAAAVYLSGAIVFVAITSLAVWRLRLPGQGGLARDFGLTLLLLVAVPALVVGTISAGCNLTYCGA